jgi:hypothetical protein
MDLEATSSSSIPDCGDSVAAYMKRPRDRANRLVPDESVYNFLSNAKQAALSGVPLWLGMISLAVVLFDHVRLNRVDWFTAKRKGPACDDYRNQTAR